MKRGLCAAALLIALIVPLFLTGCGEPDAAELAELGIDAVVFSGEELTERVEMAMIMGESSFVINYLGKIKDIPDDWQRQWRHGYICRRYVDDLRAEFEQLDGFVRASFVMDVRDREHFVQLAKNGMAPRHLAYETLGNCVEEMLLDGAEKRLFLFEPMGSIQEFDKAVYDGVKKVQANHYACEYFTDQISWAVTDYGDVIELELRLTYAGGSVPLGEMPVVRSREELVNALIVLWNTRVTATATLLLEGFSISGDELAMIMDTAESNSALAPCEADRLWYEQYPEQNGRQIVKAWLELPMGWEELQPKAVVLRADVERRAANIAANHTEEEKLYRAIYREVISAASYDDMMSEATLANVLTDDMRLRRTAYGALVKGGTVCSGYARAYKALCDYFGLECYVVSGVHNGENHAWNIVVLNGERLFVDCSFADTGGGSAYCLFDRATMEREGYLPADNFELIEQMLQ